jgi:Spy/CpxP family protein refolding chaperone
MTLKAHLSAWGGAGALACLLVALPATAADPAPGAATPAPAPEQLRREVIDRMRTLRAWKIVDELKLDQAASARLFPILSKYDDREMALFKERREIMKELRAESESATPNNSKLSTGIDRLIALRTKQHNLQDEKLRELRKALTPAQQAKLVLLLPRIERSFLHRIREVSGEHREGGPPHRRPPGDDDLE